MHVVCSAVNKSRSNFVDSAELLNNTDATILRIKLGFSNYKKGGDELINSIKHKAKCSH